MKSKVSSKFWWNIVIAIGVVFAVATFVFAMLGVWFGSNADLLGKLIGSAFIFGFAALGTIGVGVAGRGPS